MLAKYLKNLLQVEKVQFEILDDISNLLSVKLSFNGKNVADILVPLYF